MMNDELVLINVTYSTNELGDSIKVEDRNYVPCSVESVTRSEHYAAAKHDVQPEIVFVINKFDYENQQQVEYGGQRYRVIRSYIPKSIPYGGRSQHIDYIDKLELVCEGGD